MSEAERTLDPTEHRLETLRSQGQLPLAGGLITFGAVLGLLGGVFAACSLIDIQTLFSNTDTNTGGYAALSVFARGATAIAGLTALGAFVAGFLQTKMFVSWEARGRSALRNATRLQVAAVLIQWLIVVLIVIGITRGFFSGYFTGLGSPTVVSLRDTLITNSIALIRPILLVLGFSALCGWIFSRQMYRRRHRMSREEIEAEAREFEPRPEFRRMREESYRQDG